MHGRSACGRIVLRLSTLIEFRLDIFDVIL
jgi:hypothetical protein